MPSIIPQPSGPDTPESRRAAAATWLTREAEDITGRRAGGQLTRAEAAVLLDEAHRAYTEYLARPTADDRAHASQLLQLELEIRAVAGRPPASPAERPLILAGALSDVLLESSDWCPKCQASPELLCGDHAAEAELADVILRLGQQQLTGRPGAGADR